MVYVKNSGELCRKQNILQCHTLASLCFDSFQWSDSHAAFVMAKYAALTDRTVLYPIQNRPPFLLP